MINYRKAVASAPDFKEPQSIIGIDIDGKQYGIPFDPDNTDYQAFLKYQAEGGVVLPADEVTQ